MALFSKKGSKRTDSGGGAGGERWVRLGEDCTILKLLLEDPNGGIKWDNPAFRAYTARISRGPLEFLLPTRERIQAPVVNIKAGGRASMHGFHLVVTSAGRQNLRRLTGSEGVNARHFPPELLRKAQAAMRARAAVPKAAPKGAPATASPDTETTSPRATPPPKTQQAAPEEDLLGGDFEDLGPTEEEFQAYMSSGRAPGEELPEESGVASGETLSGGELSESELEEVTEAVELVEDLEPIEDTGDLSGDLEESGEFLGGEEPAVDFTSQSGAGPSEEEESWLGGGAAPAAEPSQPAAAESDAESEGQMPSFDEFSEEETGVSEAGGASPFETAGDAAGFSTAAAGEAFEGVEAGGATTLDEDDPFATLQHSRGPSVAEPEAADGAANEDVFATLDEPALVPPSESDKAALAESADEEEASWGLSDDATGEEGGGSPFEELAEAAERSGEVAEESAETGPSDEFSDFSDAASEEAEPFEGAPGSEESVAETPAPAAPVSLADSFSSEFSEFSEPSDALAQPSPAPGVETGEAAEAISESAESAVETDQFGESSEGTEPGAGASGSAEEEVPLGLADDVVAESPVGLAGEAETLARQVAEEPVSEREAAVISAADEEPMPLDDSEPEGMPEAPSEAGAPSLGVQFAHDDAQYLEAVGLGDEEIQDAEDYIREVEGGIDSRYEPPQTQEDIQHAIEEAEQLASAEGQERIVRVESGGTSPQASDHFVDITADSEIQQALSDAGEVVLTPVDPETVAAARMQAEARKPPSEESVGLAEGAVSGDVEEKPVPLGTEAFDEEESSPESKPASPREWLPFDKTNSDALKARAKEAGVAERREGMMLFNLNLTVRFPGEGELSGRLCLFEKRPALLAEGENAPRPLTRECDIAYE